MTIRVTARQLQACGIFRKHGFHLKGSAAPVGNFVQESGVNLDSTMFRAHPDSSGGIRQDLKSGGIAEWLGDRKLSYIAASEAKEKQLGVPHGFLLNDLETQCEYVIHELKHGDDGNNPKQYEDLYRQLTTETLDTFGRPRSIATLTANFMELYERPKMGAGTDKLGEVRIPYAEAIADSYARIEEAEKPEPQPAPPEPIRPEPEPKALPPEIPLPAPIHGPPISASTAGRQAAVRDMLEAMRENYVAELASIRNEIAIIDTTIADFEKLSPVPAIHATPVERLAFLPHAEQSAPTPPQRKMIMFGKSWITSVFGTGTIGAAVASVVVDAFSTGQMPSVSTILLTLAVIGTGTGLTQAKDKAVTGGTVSALTGNEVSLSATVPDSKPKMDMHR